MTSFSIARHVRKGKRSVNENDSLTLVHRRINIYVMGSTHDGTGERLGDRVRRARTRLGLSCNGLDQQVGLGTGTTSRIERGLRAHGERGATTGLLEKLATALKVRPEWLFTGAEPMEAVTPQSK